jgi:Zn-dependent protease
MFFLLFAAFTVYLSRFAADEEDPFGLDWIAFASLAILFISVLLHEIGHVWATLRLGGYVEQIVLGPLGGLGSIKGIINPRRALLAHAAGPFANLVICSLCSPILLVTPADMVGLLHPLAPVGLTDGPTTLVLLKLAFWVNWVLLIINLLPAFPFDGGQALRVAILAKWPDFGRRGASLIVSSVAKLAAATMVVLALVLEFDNANSPLPTNFVLILLAILLFFSARQQDRREEEEEAAENLLFGGGFSEGFDDPDSDAEETPIEGTGPLRRWLEQRRASRLQRQKATEAEEERRVDEILERVHEGGMESLSAEDRSLLQRVSARYRSRLGN